MRILGVRPVTVLAFGAGYLLGSKAGPGPWEAFSAKVAELQGGRAAEGGSGTGNGHRPATMTTTPAGATGS